MGLLRKLFYMEKAHHNYEKEHPSIVGITPEEMNAAVEDIARYQQTHSISQSEFPNIINYIKWKRKNPGKNVNNTSLDKIKRDIVFM